MWEQQCVVELLKKSVSTSLSWLELLSGPAALWMSMLFNTFLTWCCWRLSVGLSTFESKTGVGRLSRCQNGQKNYLRCQAVWPSFPVEVAYLLCSPSEPWFHVTCFRSCCWTGSRCTACTPRSAVSYMLSFMLMSPYLNVKAVFRFLSNDLTLLLNHGFSGYGRL